MVSLWIKKKIIKHFRKNWIRHGFETLVVMIGILGAFTLNNSNENRKDVKRERQLLRELVVNLNSNIEAFKQNTTNQLNAIKVIVPISKLPSLQYMIWRTGLLYHSIGSIRFGVRETPEITGRNSAGFITEKSEDSYFNHPISLYHSIDSFSPWCRS